MPVSLNIGCNQVYKPGFINIDENNEAIADKASAPYDLPFENNSVDHIESYYLLEQLPFEKGLLALEEWFRILKGGGILILETANIDTLIEFFLKADEPELKEAALKALYEGINEKIKHKSIYYVAILTKRLSNIGFVKIEEEIPKVRAYNEAIRIVCKKPVHHNYEMVITNTKLKFIKYADCTILEHPKLFWEFEHAIVDLFMKPLLLQHEATQIIKDELFYKIISYSPLLAKHLIYECQEHQMIEKDLIPLTLSIIDKLIKCNFITSNYKAMLDLPKAPEPTMNYYINVLENSSLLISKLFNTSDDKIIDETITEHLNEVYEHSKSINIDLSTDVFSYELIKDKSEYLTSFATKSFANSDFNTAKQIYSMSLQINPEQLLAYLSLGLLEVKQKNYENALNYFTQGLNLVETVKQNDIIMLNIGMCHLYLQNYEQAIKSIINTETESTEKFQVLGNSYYLLQEYNEALEAFSWATILKNYAINYMNLALTCEKLNMREQAESNFEQAAIVDPKLPRPALPYLPLFKILPYSVDEL